MDVCFRLKVTEASALFSIELQTDTLMRRHPNDPAEPDLCRKRPKGGKERMPWQQKQKKTERLSVNR